MKKSTKKIKVICSICNAEFEVYPYRNRVLYCSRKCKAIGFTQRAKIAQTEREKIGLKKCTKCGGIKPLTQFYKSKQKFDGLDSWCRRCKLEDNKKYNEKHKEEKKEYHRNHHISNRNKHLIQSKENNIKLKYGITLEQYNELLSNQGFQCGICGNLISGRTAHLDHNHETGEIRGFLCDFCNKGLGCFKDNKAIMRKAVYWLDCHKDIKHVCNVRTLDA